jgi:hypothetical protein
MAELPVCRRTTDPVGGDTACPHKMTAHTNVSGPAHVTTRPVANALSTEGQFGAGNSLPAPHGGSATGGARPLFDQLPFAEIWAVDFEFGAKLGENPEPVCLVARELRSGNKLRLWRDEFGALPP